MSKLNEALVMMAEQKETFEVNGKTFQIIEVKESEQPKVRVTMADPNAKPVEVILEKIQPDYSHLVGKWVKCVDAGTSQYFTVGKYYVVRDDLNNPSSLVDDTGRSNGWHGENHLHFDLSNPSDTNPDEKKVWEKANEAMWEYNTVNIDALVFYPPKGFAEHLQSEWKHIRAYLFLSKFANLCNEGRVVDWNDIGQTKYTVEEYCGLLDSDSYGNVKRHISFLDIEARDYSLKVHEQIWKDYWGIE